MVVFILCFIVADLPANKLCQKCLLALDLSLSSMDGVATIIEFIGKFNIYNLVKEVHTCIVFRY